MSILSIFIVLFFTVVSLILLSSSSPSFSLADSRSQHRLSRRKSSFVDLEPGTAGDTLNMGDQNIAVSSKRMEKRHGRHAIHHPIEEEKIRHRRNGGDRFLVAGGGGHHDRPGEEDPRDPEQIKHDQHLLKDDQSLSLKQEHKAVEEEEKIFDSAGVASFFGVPKIAHSEKCAASKTNKLMAWEQAKPEEYFERVKNKARTVCTEFRPLRVKKDAVVKSAKTSDTELSDFATATHDSKLTEYTARFSDGSTLGIQFFENLILPVADVIENLEDFTCRPAAASSSSSAEAEADSPSKKSPTLTNVKGDRFTPSWYSTQEEFDVKQNKQQEAEEAIKKRQSDSAKTSRPEIKELSGGTEQDPLKIDKSFGPIIRFNRPRPGNMLSNLELLFDLFVAKESLPKHAFKRNEKKGGEEQFTIVFTDDSAQTARFADFISFRPFIEEPNNQLIFEDTWKSLVKNNIVGSQHGNDPYDFAAATANLLIQFPVVIEFSSSPLTSVLLSSSSSPATPEENEDDHSSSSSSGICPSPIFQRFIEWFHFKLGAEQKPSPREKSDRKLRVLWVSRGPCRDKFKSKSMHLPKRRFTDEMQFLLDLADELGHGVDLQQIEFGEKDAHQSIYSLRNTDVMVGVHGAGLTWSAFLPQGRSALVEIFTHDLLSSSSSSSSLSASSKQQQQHSNNNYNVTSTISPYRKIAAWTGIEYASVELKDTRYIAPPFKLPFPGEQRELLWKENHVKKIAEVIKKQLPLKKKLMENRKWCV